TLSMTSLHPSGGKRTCRDSIYHVHLGCRTASAHVLYAQGGRDKYCPYRSALTPRGTSELNTRFKPFVKLSGDTRATQTSSWPSKYPGLLCRKNRVCVSSFVGTASMLPGLSRWGLNVTTPVIGL